MAVNWLSLSTINIPSITGITHDLTDMFFSKRKVNFVGILILMMTAKACFGSGGPEPLDDNKICQDKLGADYVWEQTLRTCVQCTSCTPGAQDPHCITCQALGIISYDTTPSSGGTKPQPDAGTSTHSPSSGMSSTSHRDVTNDDNKGSEASSKVLWVLLPCLGVATIVLLIHVCKCKLYTYILKRIARPIQWPTQETVPPVRCSESQLMTVLSTDGLGNHAGGYAGVTSALG